MVELAVVLAARFVVVIREQVRRRGGHAGTHQDLELDQAGRFTRGDQDLERSRGKVEP